MYRLRKRTTKGVVPESSIKVQFVSLGIENSEQLVPFLTIKDNFVPFLYKRTFPSYQRNTFLATTIVPKSSINDQFVPLGIRNSEQLVPLLAIKDHFVPK